MWRWLPSVLCNKSLFCISQRRLFFLQLMGIVFGIHFTIFMLYGIVGWLQSGKDRFKISLTQSGATYVLMPLQKKVEQQNRTTVSHASSLNKKSNVIDHATYQRKKNARKKSKTIVASKKTSKKTKSKIAAAKAGAKPQKQQASVLMRAQHAQKLKSKKVLAKKAVTQMQEVVEVEEIVQTEQQVVPKVAPTEVVSTEVVSTPAKSIEQAKEFESIQDVAASIDDDDTKEIEQELSADDDFDANNVIFVGYEELDQSIIGSKIQHTIQQNWTPPVGMSKDISCEVRVKIGADGQAMDAKVAKTSGIFVYDACARTTLLAIEYPKEVYNKSITILLG